MRSRHALHLRRPHACLAATLIIGLAACISQTSFSVQGQGTRRTPLDAAPISVGDREVGNLVRRDVGLAIADSIIRSWGWRVAAVDDARSELRTDWLYFDGPAVVPGAGRQCDDGAGVGLRLLVQRERSVGDSAQFSLHGDVSVPSGIDRAVAQRVARDGFASVADALTDKLRFAAQRRDTTPVYADAGSGNPGVARGTNGCRTVQR
ncbi:MAG TPA: hypothetical protein VN651_14115 [Gemmatimonadaceae bacterium]|nr:hypothetical protein [Gemmatimonadaceae bacterium]